MEFRKPEESDRGEISRIIRASFSRIYAYWAGKSFDDLSAALAAYDSGVLAGVIDWRVFELADKKAPYLFWLAVREDYRRKGVGSALMQKAMDILAGETGGEPVLASVERGNRASIGMLKKLGFERVTRGEMRKRYGKGSAGLLRQMWVMPWEDVYLLDKGGKRHP